MSDHRNASKHPQLSRRNTLVLGAAALTSVLAPRANAEQVIERHGISAFGDLKYPPDLKHFAYVNPNAPKGGVFSHIGSSGKFNQNVLTFNSLNSFILKGDGAQGMDLTFATLMTRAADEPDALYGLAARAVQISEDGLAYRFLLRQGLKFHDGSPLTAHDVAFSLKALKEKGHPIARLLLRDFTVAEALDDTTVVVRFAVNKARDAPLFVALNDAISPVPFAARGSVVEAVYPNRQRSGRRATRGCRSNPGSGNTRPDQMGLAEGWPHAVCTAGNRQSSGS